MLQFALWRRGRYSKPWPFSAVRPEAFFFPEVPWMKPETLPRSGDGGKNSELGARALARALSQLQHMLNSEPSSSVPQFPPLWNAGSGPAVLYMPLDKYPATLFSTDFLRVPPFIYVWED